MARAQQRKRASREGREQPTGQPWSNLRIAALICVAGALAYANSFRGAFVFDDPYHISPTLLDVAAPSLRECFSGVRSAVQCSLWLDYARGGFDPFPFHVTNLLIHLCAALALYAVVLRATRLAAPTTAPSTVQLLAAATSLLWVVHPLNTQAVTYIIQRAESLASLMYVLTFYAALRRFEGRRIWTLVAGFCLFIGVCCKQIVVTAPFVILLFDRTFVSGSFLKAFRRHPDVYAPFLVPLGWLLYMLGGGRSLFAAGGAAGFTSAGFTPFRYLLSQGGVLFHYLRLAIVPYPLCIDYRWPPAYGLSAWIPTLAWVGIAAYGLRGLWRDRPVGFLICAFLLVLAPTSSVLPIADIAVEHRMYLALALVLVLAQIALSRTSLSQPQLRQGATVVGVAFIALTLLRNHDYASPLRLYKQTVSVSPDNVRARYNLGNELAKRNRNIEAIPNYERALELYPGYLDVYNNLALSYLSVKRVTDARRTLERGLMLRPSDIPMRLAMAYACKLDNDLGCARRQVDAVLAIDPNNEGARHDLALLEQEH